MVGRREPLLLPVPGIKFKTCFVPIIDCSEVDVTQYFFTLGQAGEEQNIHLYQHANLQEQQKRLTEQPNWKELLPGYILCFGLW